MKLLTHNLLRSNVKGVKKGYPLRIEVGKVEVKETEFNSEFIKRMLDRLDWAALRSATSQLDPNTKLPEAIGSPDDEAFLRLVHHALIELVLIDGYLVCPESGRKFRVENGIPNMLLNEDEI
jgi:multifunctional methyltransferase subunit TRM112